MAERTHIEVGSYVTHPDVHWSWSRVGRPYRPACQDPPVIGIVTATWGRRGEYCSVEWPPRPEADRKRWGGWPNTSIPTQELTDARDHLTTQFERRHDYDGIGK